MDFVLLVPFVSSGTLKVLNYPLISTFNFSFGAGNYVASLEC